MLRPLLCLMLVTTQLLSWSTLSLHLCVHRDGSICVDQGPGCCDCHRHRHRDEAPLDTGESHFTRDFATSRLQERQDADGCDCTHIQISQPQSPKIRASFESGRLLAQVPPNASALHAAGSFAANQVLCLAASSVHRSALPLRALATVILRC